MPTSLAAAFARLAGADPAQPLLTWYSSESATAAATTASERTELSGATLANWVNKTANLLTLGCGLGPGDVASVELPQHWQSAAIVLGCWTAGLEVASSVAPAADVAFVLPSSDTAYQGEVFVTQLHPFALPVASLAPGASDWVLTARAHGDDYAGPTAWPSAPAFAGLSHAALLSRALTRATELGIGAGDRVLINVDSYPALPDWLAAPIAAGASLVLCTGTLDLDHIATTEKATRCIP